MKEIKSVREIKDVRDSLVGWAENPDGISDHLNDELGKNFVELSATIRECRDALTTIEVSARNEVERCAKWHRDSLAEIESLGVLPKV